MGETYCGNCDRPINLCECRERIGRPDTEKENMRLKRALRKIRRLRLDHGRGCKIHAGARSGPCDCVISTLRAIIDDALVDKVV